MGDAPESPADLIFLGLQRLGLSSDEAHRNMRAFAELCVEWHEQDAMAAYYQYRREIELENEDRRARGEPVDDDDWMGLFDSDSLEDPIDDQARDSPLRLV